MFKSHVESHIVQRKRLKKPPLQQQDMGNGNVSIWFATESANEMWLHFQQIKSCSNHQWTVYMLGMHNIGIFNLLYQDAYMSLN